ncbi:MAG TPA: hypothetical protein VMB47_09345 [Candidatus Aquilonibacter sp.]|nr:hypothetical protein [Candidatus Aquilonibacter sp.]
MSPREVVPVTGVVPFEQLAEGDDENARLLKSMAADAEKYLSSFSWCRSIESRYFGYGIGKILSIFLYRITPAMSGFDSWLWVVVGDIPPAYLVVDECQTPSQALSAYLHEMTRWVKLAEKGRESRDVIPVNVPATPKWARELGARLEFIRLNLLPYFKEAETLRA